MTPERPSIFRPSAPATRFAVMRGLPQVTDYFPCVSESTGGRLTLYGLGARDPRHPGFHTNASLNTRK